MNEKKIKSVIGEWFRSVKNAAGPILPDGWQSRPYDDTRELGGVTVYDDSLLMTLQCGGQLMVSRPCAIRRDEKDLVFENYEQACWSDSGREYRYMSGQIRFVPSS